MSCVSKYNHFYRVMHYILSPRQSIFQYFQLTEGSIGHLFYHLCSLFQYSMEDDFLNGDIRVVLENTTRMLVLENTTRMLKKVFLCQNYFKKFVKLSLVSGSVYNASLCKNDCYYSMAEKKYWKISLGVMVIPRESIEFSHSGLRPS